MVLAEKGSENARNGRRSRGPSPNGHVVAESTSEDESVPVDKIRVGRDYQAVCPPLQPVETRRPDTLQDRALLVWSPTVDIPETKLDEYITLAKEKYGYNGEQALGMLFWHKHDLERAVLDLANFTPFPDEWSVEDKVLFEQAFQFHGKSFHRIRQMLPDKSIASLVKYYYSWKKTRTRTSLMDKQARKLTTQRDGTTIVGGVVVSGGGGGGATTGGVIDISATSDGNTSDNGGVGTGGGGGSASADESDTDDKNEAGGICGNCGVSCSLTHHSTKGQQLCHSCYQHWRRTGTARPTSGPGTHTSGRRGGVGSIQRHKRRPPRGMYINHDDLVAMAASPHGQLMLRAMDREIISLKRQVQHNKQIISTLKKKTCDGIQDLQPNIQQHLNIINNTTNISAQQLTQQTQINAKWTQDELLLAVQGVRKYGKDFKTIADVIGTKNEAHLKSFFTNYRKRYHLDDIIKDYELEHGVIQPLSSNTENTESTETITNNNDTNGNKMDIDTNHSNINTDNDNKVEIMDTTIATTTLTTTITDSTSNGVSNVDNIKNIQSKSISLPSK